MRTAPMIYILLQKIIFHARMTLKMSSCSKEKGKHYVIGPCLFCFFFFFVSARILSSYDDPFIFHRQMTFERAADTAFV